MITATTVWLLMLTTPGGTQSLQSIHQTPEACHKAAERFRRSPYYTIQCQPKETLR